MNIEEATVKALSGKLDNNKMIKTESIDNDAIDDLIECAVDLDEGSSTTECYGDSDICFSIFRRIDDYVCYEIKAWYDDSEGNEVDLDEAVITRGGLKSFFKNTVQKAIDNGYVLDESKEPKEEFLDPNITIAPSVDLGDGAGLGMLAGML